MTLAKGNAPLKPMKLSDFPRLFPFGKIASDLRVKSTHSRPLDKIYLDEYLPLQPVKGKIEGYRYEEINDFVKAL